MNKTISYKTNDNHEITYILAEHNNIDNYEIREIGLRYAEITGKIPTHAYIGVDLYRNYLPDRNAYTGDTNFTDEKLYLTEHFPGIGILQLIPVLKPGRDFILVGQTKDYERYIADELFEKEVLK